MPEQWLLHAYERMHAELGQLRSEFANARKQRDREIAELKERNDALARVAACFYEAGHSDALSGHPRPRHLQAIKAVMLALLLTGALSRCLPPAGLLWHAVSPHRRNAIALSLQPVARGQAGVRGTRPLVGQVPRVDLDHRARLPASDAHAVQLGPPGVQPVVGERAPEPVRRQALDPSGGTAAFEHVLDSGGAEV